MKTKLCKEELAGSEDKIKTMCSSCVYGRHEECDKEIECICASTNHDL